MRDRRAGWFRGRLSLDRYPREFSHKVGDADVYRIVMPRWREWAIHWRLRIARRLNLFVSVRRPCGCIEYRHNGYPWTICVEHFRVRFRA